MGKLWKSTAGYYRVLWEKGLTLGESVNERKILNHENYGHADWYSYMLQLQQLFFKKGIALKGQLEVTAHRWSRGAQIA